MTCIMTPRIVHCSKTNLHKEIKLNIEQFAVFCIFLFSFGADSTGADELDQRLNKVEVFSKSMLKINFSYMTTVNSIKVFILKQE